MDRRRLLLGLTLTALPQWARADTKPPVPLSKVFMFLDRYLALPPAERSRFTLSYQILIGDKPAGGLKGVILEADGRHTPLNLDPDGRVKTLPTLAQLKSATLQIEVPPGSKMGLVLELLPILPLTQDPSVRDMDLAIAQANHGIAAAVGVLSIAAPRSLGWALSGLNRVSSIMPMVGRCPCP
ncbi:MAG: hypothetical protein CGW95_01990 [Phenylobacterium zucineum]|nr:MAG: hypothetical protein CGW95_01990 [Phenylobacterium zucineum]